MTPVIVHVDAINQTAEVELDEEDHNFLAEEAEKASKNPNGSKTKKREGKVKPIRKSIEVNRELAS